MTNKGVDKNLLRMIAPDEGKVYSGSSSRRSSFLQSGSVFVAILTLSKNSVGAGVLALSQKTMYSGIPVFLVLLAVGGFFTAKSIQMISKGADHTGKFVFEEITEIMLGRGMSILVGISMFLNLYGGMIVYVIAIKDSLEALLEQVQASTGVNWPLYATLIVGATVLIPFSVVEKLNSLRVLSLAGVIGVFFTVTSVVYAFSLTGLATDLAVKGSSETETVMTPQGGFVDIMTAVSTITFAFCNQFNVPQIYGELTVKTPSNARRIAYFSSYLTMGVYVVTAVCGYLCYGLEIQGNILLNFKPLIEAGSIIIYLGVVAVIVSVCMCHLLSNFPLRLSVLFFLPPRYENNRIIKLSVPLFTAVSTIAIALLYSNLGMFLGLVGAVTGSVICYIVPALLSIRASEMDGPSEKTVGPSSWLAKVWSHPTEYLMVLVGLIIGVVGTFCEFYSCFN